MISSYVIHISSILNSLLLCNPTSIFDFKGASMMANMKRDYNLINTASESFLSFLHDDSFHLILQIIAP